MSKALFFVLPALFLIAGAASAQEITCVQREDCERQLAEIEAQIDKQQETIAEYQKQGKTLQREVSLLNTNINKLNLQIKAINLTLSSLDKDIAATRGQITEAENKLGFNKNVLAELIRRLNEESGAGLMEILLKNSRFSDFFGNLNNTLTVKDSLSATIAEITGLRDDLIEKKDDLADKRSDAAALKAQQDAQKASVARKKAEKDALLKVTKGQESKYQAILKETQKTAAQIRGQLFEFIGGGSLTFEKAYEFAKVAEKATGIRAAFIMAILDHESALGRNVGRCDYATAMAPGPPRSRRDDITPFLALIARLKAVGSAPPEPIKVSCANADGAYGGAMGPAQFIPTTWMLYEKRIAGITGSNPPNPWSHGDAFVATGLYLADSYNSSACRNYAEENKNALPKQFLQERCAAARYYAGGRWYTFRFQYGDPVVKKAEQFQRDIDVLGG